MKNKKEIVKVQVSVVTTNEPSQVLIYNQRQTYFEELSITAKLVKLMDGKFKKYFYARLPKGNKGVPELVEPAPWQPW